MKSNKTDEVEEVVETRTEYFAGFIKDLPLSPRGIKPFSVEEKNLKRIPNSDSCKLQQGLLHPPSPVE